MEKRKIFSEKDFLTENWESTLKDLIHETKIHGGALCTHLPSNDFLNWCVIIKRYNLSASTYLNSLNKWENDENGDFIYWRVILKNYSI